MSVECEKFIDRYLDSKLQLNFKKLPLASFGLALKVTHHRGLREAEFSADTSTKTEYHKGLKAEADVSIP